MLALLLFMGVAGRFLIQWLTRRAREATDATKTPWDDVIVNAAAGPIEWALWVVIVYLSLGVAGDFEALQRYDEARGRYGRYRASRLVSTQRCSQC